MSTRYETEFYSRDIPSIRESLKRIADALEENNTLPCDKIDSAELDNFRDIPGFEGTLKDLHDLKLHTDEGESCDDDHVHNDYLNDLVTEMTKEQYADFHNENSLSFSLNDAVTMTNYIYSLEYEECLGAVKQALAIIGDDADDPNLEVQLNQDECCDDDCPCNKELASDFHKPTSDNPDPAGYGNKEYETDLQGIRKDDDHDIRSAAHSYEAAIDEDLHTKKDCILDYVTNEFGILGARYTDIIKFAYYLGSPNAPKYSNENRGYYSLALAGGRGFLVKGGKDQLVKGINNEGKEKYFALSFVDQATDYYKTIE